MKLLSDRLPEFQVPLSTDDADMHIREPLNLPMSQLKFYAEGRMAVSRGEVSARTTASTYERLRAGSMSRNAHRIHTVRERR
jgi:hypothetical protein